VNSGEAQGGLNPSCFFFSLNPSIPLSVFNIKDCIFAISLALVVAYSLLSLPRILSEHLFLLLQVVPIFRWILEKLPGLDPSLLQ